MKNFASLLSLMMLVGTAAQADTQVTCSAQRLFVVSFGATETITKFKFVESFQGNTPVLKSLKGSIVFPEYGVKTIKDANGELVKMVYSMDVALANPNYRPTKYYNHYQFKDLKGSSSRGGLDLQKVDLLLPSPRFGKTGSFDAQLTIGLDQNGARMTMNCSATAI